ncbi:hypothetical protein CENSYa_1066 [Cenarchaeum symbiosum A]|uniref:Uncharacterized protein n=1 Tax=Cenarchaeum symbiosum (strain A) TaxID=414004 RepID=A0RWH9_CENSY|nr:hypothetical protein CENSYa_1066 [Cenarchaeum symbiosum A]
MREEDATAICMACFQRSRVKPVSLLSFAVACRVLLKKWGIKEMSRYFEISEYQIRQADKINELEPRFQKLADERHSGIEMFYHIWRLPRQKRSEVAKMALGMNIKDLRELMYFMRKNPSFSIKKCRELVDETKPKVINLLVLPLDSDMYDGIKRKAQKSKMSVRDYVMGIIMSKINEV